MEVATEIDINLKNYVKPKEAMEIIGLKKSAFYNLMPWFYEQKGIEKRGQFTFVSRDVLRKYNQEKHRELYG